MLLLRNVMMVRVTMKIDDDDDDIDDDEVVECHCFSPGGARK